MRDSVLASSLTKPADGTAASPALRAFDPEGGHVERFKLADSLHGVTRDLVANSPGLLEVIRKAQSVARSKVPVLFQGESGTGKELLARLVHDHSPRKARRFVQVNCAAFSENLIESELFGHERGAFTGAEQRHAGYFERADKGSLLLDEIGEMPHKLQAKLLRVLEEEAFERVGGETSIKVDVRIIATTNRELEQEVARGDFRRDLFYRLNAIALTVPPLRQRLDDLRPLAQYFVGKFGDQGDPCVTAISNKAIDLLRGYSWPGNVRQLRNVIHYACVLARGGRIEATDLPELRESGDTPASTSKLQTLAEIERQRILETLRDVGGNRTAAAFRLGVTVRTLQNKLKRYREDAA